jgi:long-chain acyl-CoA synthetase
MSKDHFRAWFEKRSWTVGVQYVLARSIFNTYALPQRMSGVKAALEYTGELVQRGYCPLVFPEGERTSDGSMHPFRPGIGLMAVRLQVPVIPSRITGLYEVYSVHDAWPKRGSARIRFGPPLRFSSNTPVEQATRAIEQAVQDLMTT